MGWRELLFGVEKRPEERSGPLFSVSDPALAEYLGIGTRSIAGVSVTETSALGSTAFYRCVAIIAGTIATLPLKVYRRGPDGSRSPVASCWLSDDPSGPYPLSPFAWTELLMLHLLVRGEAFLFHIYGGAGQLIGLWPIHPGAVEVKWAGADKIFKVHAEDGSSREYDTSQMTQIMGPSMDGLRGMSPLSVFRHTIGLGLAGEYAAGRTIGNGLTISGLVTTETGVDVEEEEAVAIKAGLSAKLTGVENAGDIAFVNRSLKFTPWAMTNSDAQFLEQRAFQVEEFARMYGVPPHLLGQTEKQTSWGTGVAEQNLGLARYTLMGWTSRIEQSLSDLLPRPQYAEFEYAGLLQGTPQDEIKLLLEQVKGGLLTVDEARAIRNLPPMPESEKPQPVADTEDEPEPETAPTNGRH